MMDFKEGMGMRIGAVALLALSACNQGTAPPAFPAAFQPGIVLAAEPELLEAAPATRFNFGVLRDLWVRVKVPDMGQLMTVSLAVTSPGGARFHETTQRFSPDEGMTQMEMPGSPHALTVLRAKRAPGGWLLDYPIAISGTVFTRNPTPGVWLIEARTEGRLLSTDFEAEYLY
jgi:hypothetical protein